VTVAAKRDADFDLPAGKLVVLGDSRPRDYFEFFLEDSRAIPARVFDAVAAERPVAVIHCGDLAVFGAAERFWQGWSAFDRDVRALTEASIPIFPAIGNHEYRGSTRRPLEHFFARFPHLQRRHYYAVRSGGTLFLCLDSNLGRLTPERRAAQDAWLRDWLAAARADDDIVHVVPIVHHPPFTNIARCYLVFEAHAVREQWVPWFLAEPKVELVFAGHVHTYEHIVEHGKHFVVTGGAGSPRFRLRPPDRRRRHDVWPESGLIRPFHYVRLTETPPRGLLVEVVCLQADGWHVGESFTIA
jgi:hypothetical protein